MKYNLENRPKKHIHYRLGKRIGAHYHQADIDEWFEGFEKELRKILEPDTLRILKVSNPRPNRYVRALIKEILGE